MMESSEMFETSTSRQSSSSPGGEQVETHDQQRWLRLSVVVSLFVGLTAFVGLTNDARAQEDFARASNLEVVLQHAPATEPVSETSESGKAAHREYMIGRYLIPGVVFALVALAVAVWSLQSESRPE